MIAKPFILPPVQSDPDGQKEIPTLSESLYQRLKMEEFLSPTVTGLVQSWTHN